MQETDLLPTEETRCCCETPIWDTVKNIEMIKGVTVYRCFNCREIVPLEHYYCDSVHTKYTGVVLESYIAKRVNHRRVYSCGTCHKLIVNQNKVRIRLYALSTAILGLLSLSIYITT